MCEAQSKLADVHVIVFMDSARQRRRVDAQLSTIGLVTWVSDFHLDDVSRLEGFARSRRGVSRS